MKYTRGQFTNEYYKLWELGLLIPIPDSASLYSVQYRKNGPGEFSRITLHATSVSDALERACYALTYSSPSQPEDIDLQAVYDSEENLLWIDEPFYEIVQKKNEFRGMNRREFLFRFGVTSAAALFALRPLKALAGTTTTALSGTSSGFPVVGEQIYSTAGTFSWVVPAGVSSLCAVGIGGGGAGGGVGSGGYSFSAGNGGGGGALAYINTLTVTPGETLTAIVGSGGAGVLGGTGNTGGTTQLKRGATILLSAVGGSGGLPADNTATASGGAAGSCVGTAAFSGGSGSARDYTSIRQGAGGGAAGYAGNGGNAVTTANGSTGAGGGGGGGSSEQNQAGGGGGTGLLGQGSNGAGGTWISSGTANNAMGKGGSGGSNGTVANGGAGGNYGGGGAGGFQLNSTGGAGGIGALRIIWGTGRNFPSNAT